MTEGQGIVLPGEPLLMIELSAEQANVTGNPLRQCAEELKQIVETVPDHLVLEVAKARKFIVVIITE